jgi:hypothetical protein
MVTAAVAFTVTTLYVVRVRCTVEMRTEPLGAGVAVVRCVVVVEFENCRFNLGMLGLVGATTGMVGSGMLGRLVSRPPKPPRPKGQLIVEIAVTVLGYRVTVYRMVLVTSVVSRYAKVEPHW